jgi:hypothetical protein
MPADQAGGLPAGAGGAREGRAGDPHQARYALDNTSCIRRKEIVCFYLYSSFTIVEYMDQITIKTPNPKGRLFLKIYLLHTV